MSGFQRVRRLGMAGLTLVSGLAMEAAWAYTAPASTPPGITVVDVSKLMDEGSPQFLWRRLGDARGNPLYTYDADQGGKSSCYDECAREFPPLVAGSHARKSGDWSITVRDDHVRQWTYQGKPLYRYSGKDPRGEPQGARFQLEENPAWHDPASKVYSPKRGWRRVAYTPERTTVMPTSVELELLAVADGFGFVDSATRMTIYAAPVGHALSSDWRPVRAADLAVPLGQFSISNRKDDGTRQWTYRGEALYTYAGDYAPGDTNGIFTGDRSIQAALAYRNFMPPGVEIGDYVGRGPLMTTAKGQTLYFAARYHATYGGREAPAAYSVSYNELKAQGSVACEGDCTMTWKPLLAAADAQPSGFWELIDRPRGERQWVYKGSPVYTFIGDTRPGDTEGNNRNVIVYGGAHGQVVFAYAGGDPHSPQMHVGDLTMLAAAGDQPGDKAPYVAGDGYVGAAAARDDAPIGPGQPQSQRGHRGADATAGATGAVAAASGQPALSSYRRGPRDHGAGFYWHTVPLF